METFLALIHIVCNLHLTTKYMQTYFSSLHLQPRNFEGKCYIKRENRKEKCQEKESIDKSNIFFLFANFSIDKKNPVNLFFHCS